MQQNFQIISIKCSTYLIEDLPSDMWSHKNVSKNFFELPSSSPEIEIILGSILFKYGERHSRYSKNGCDLRPLSLVDTN